MVKESNPLDFVNITVIDDENIGPAILISYPKGIDKFKEAVAKW